GILLGEAQRGSDPEDVPVEAAFADQDAHTFHVLHGAANLVFRRRLELPVRHQLDAEHETRPPHVADNFVLVLESAEAVLEVGADGVGVRLEALLLEHPEHGEPAGGAQRVATERVEVAPPCQHLRDLRRRHHRAQRDARNGLYLGHGDYVGDDAVGLEPPEVAADAREAGLDLVGDAQPAGAPDRLVRQRQVPRRQLHDPTDALYRLRYEAGDLPGGAELDDLLHVARVLFGVGAERAPSVFIDR
ncbi:Os03g0338100, partial [Oryza sativa Japonica Group]